MKNQPVMENNKKSAVLTIIGVAIMILLTITKAVTSSNIASYSVFVGYHKSGNCVISTFSHILGNAISLVAIFLFF